MSPVTSLVLLLTFSYLSSSVVLEYDSDPTVVKHGTYEGSTRDPSLGVHAGGGARKRPRIKVSQKISAVIQQLFHGKELTSIFSLHTEKPGTCPLDVDYPTCNPTVDYVPECRTDKECKGPRKCCWSGCRKCCLLPLQPKLNPCPYFDHSICIRVRPLPAECHNDNQCQGTDRCCCANCRRQCTPTEKVKPGQCPAPKKKIIATSCTKDHDCIGDKKCCKEKGLKCVKPEQEHPGVCPISLEQLSCIYLNMTLCKRDSDCPPNKKCCLTEDNNLQCQKVKNEIPEKECPVVATLVRCEEPYAAPECHGDCDCRPGQRCCDVGCRMACRDL